jgi:hypothetical protein
MDIMTAQIAPLERDTMFAAYRSWQAVTQALTDHVDAAVHGQAVDWMRFDAKLELWRALQDQFLSTLRTCAVDSPHAAAPLPPDIAA